MSEQRFTPAESFDEATSRIYIMTGGKPQSGVPGKSRGVRSALTALAAALGVDDDRSWTSAMVAERLAAQLAVEWESSYVEKTSLSLPGLNALLAGACRAFAQGSLSRVTESRAPGLEGSEWQGFNPAPSKIEAVARIAALTNAPREWLGPGSKEHKSALLNLADRLFPADTRIDRSSKHRLGASLAQALEVPWSDDFTATGQTIKLSGLNAVLAGAERHLGRLGESVADALTTPESEGAAIAAALLASLPLRWEGRTAVRWLEANELRGANDLEWQGFFGEERARGILNRSFTQQTPGPRLTYGSTKFDYGLTWPWDIKVHTEFQTSPGSIKRSSSVMLLNDERAVRECVREQGLGFVVVNGVGHMDHSGEFKRWQDARKLARSGKAPAPSNSGRSRMRKAAFEPLRVDAFWINDPAVLEIAIGTGALIADPQGRQAPRAVGEEGVPRAPKFKMNLAIASREIRVASYSWPSSLEA